MFKKILFPKSFYEKYCHVGDIYLNIPEPWEPSVKECIIKMEKIIWPQWVPMFFKRLLFYFGCKNGYYNVRNRFLYKIIYKLTNGILILQIKDKFAMLRIYLSETTPELEFLILKTTQKCKKICEKCGSDFETEILNHNGWLYNYCSKCRHSIFKKESENKIQNIHS